MTGEAMRWEAFPYVVLGVVIVLLPFGVISLYASRLTPRQRTGFLVLYGATVLLLIVLAADVANAFSNRLAADLILLVGGIALGVYVGRFGPLSGRRNRDGK